MSAQDRPAPPGATRGQLQLLGHRFVGLVDVDAEGAPPGLLRVRPLDGRPAFFVGPAAVYTLTPAGETATVHDEDIPF